jgi:hypothetical protein
VHFDTKVASAHSIAWEETQRLWQEGIDKKYDSIATAAAGTVLYASYGAHGGTLTDDMIHDLKYANIFRSMF